MGANEAQEFCLKWNNHHSTLISVLDSLLVRESLVDVVLAAEGKSIKVHRFVLFACSSYFQELLNHQMDKQAVIFMKDVKFNDLKALVDFMYRGEVNISQFQLESFLQTAEALHIKGLADRPNQRKLSSTIGSSKPAKKGPANHYSPIENNESVVEPQQQVKLTTGLPKLSRSSKAPKRPVAAENPTTPADAAVEGDEPPPAKKEMRRPVDEEEDDEVDDTGPDADHTGDAQDDQVSIREEDEDWSAGNSHHSFDGNQETGNDIWASENGAGNNSENNYDLLSDSSLGPGGESRAGDESQLVVEDEAGGERPFSCPRCGRRYKRKNNAVAHLRYECGVVPSFPCPICSHMLSQRRYIQKHIRRKHPEFLAEYIEQLQSEKPNRKNDMDDE